MSINIKEDRIRCGKCSSEYHPRSSLAVSGTPVNITQKGFSESMDYSCPVCGHGKFQEGFDNLKNKTILKD